MTAAALALVLGSALLHATWNLLAKRARGGVAFLWLLTVGTAVVYAPVAGLYLWLARPEVTAAHAGAALVSSAIHVGYFLSLQRGYRVGDLSLVYPLARGSGPAVATLLAIALLGERPSPTALVGAALVGVSVAVLTGRGRAEPGRGRAAVAYGLLTGLFIGAYTVWDGYAVNALGAPPVVYLYLGEVGRLVLLAPFVLARLSSGEPARTWRESRWEALGVATLSPLAYLLVLTAMTFTPVSLVAPAREVSILVGAAFGALLIDPDAIIKVANFLRGADFYRPRHALIYEAIFSLNERHEPVDFVTLVDELERVLGIQACPMNWPLGNGPDFRGVWDRVGRAAHLFERTPGGAFRAPLKMVGLADPALKAKLDAVTYETVCDEIAMVEGAGSSFDAAGGRVAAVAGSRSFAPPERRSG